MSKIIKLNKGLDIKLEGQAASVVVNAPLADTYAVSPLDFEGVTPKLLVKAGDQVKVGTPLFFNKYNERVLFTSPVSGTVEAVNRGEKRKVLSVTVKPDAEQQYEEFAIPDLSSATRDQIVGLLLKAGLWTMIIQRPYGIIADPDDAPKAIFVSAFDSAPLAPDYNFALAGEKAALQRGVEVLKKLTAGKVHVSFRAGAEGEAATLEGVELHAFAGKHPAGNVGVQIHHIDPVNKGEVVWTVNVQDLATIGRFFSTGKVDRSKVIAVTGSEVAQPQYCRIIDGASIRSIVGGNIKPQAEGESIRYISGNVLTGVKTSLDGHIGYYAHQLTLIPEGDKYELLGWAMPRCNKFSVSRAYFSWLCPKKRYNLDTNLNGGERPFVVTGLYEQYLPFLASTFDAFETFLFVPNTTTQKGAHIRDCNDMKRTMIVVVVALLPALLFGMYNTGYQVGMTGWAAFWFGFLQVLPMIVVSYVVGLGIEFAFAQARGHEVNEGFLVSGLLIPMVMPVGTPLWMIALGTAFAVVFGKEVFGGTGMNVFNPALLARAFVFFDELFESGRLPRLHPGLRGRDLDAGDSHRRCDPALHGHRFVAHDALGLRGRLAHGPALQCGGRQRLLRDSRMAAPDRGWFRLRCRLHGHRSRHFGTDQRRQVHRRPDDGCAGRDDPCGEPCLSRGNDAFDPLHERAGAAGGLLRGRAEHRAS